MGHNSPQYLHTVVETVKLAFADRDRYYGDPKFSKIPEEMLLSKEYAAERRKLIDPQNASMESRPGSFGAAGPHADAEFRRRTRRAATATPLASTWWMRTATVLRDAQRRVAAVGHRRRHRHSVRHPPAELCC